MFKLTSQLVAHAVKHLGLDAELAKDVQANESAIRTAITKSLDDGKLKYSQLEELQVEKASGEELLRKAVSEAMSPIAEQFTSALGELTKALRAGGAGNDGASLTDPTPVEPKGEKAAEPAPGAKAYQAAAHAGTSEKDEVRARVKSIAESFNTTKSFLPNQTKSMLVRGVEGGQDRMFDGINELEQAVAGATLKYLMNRAEAAGQGRCPQWAKMTDLDRKLMEYAAHEMEWVGPVGMRGSDDEEAEYGWAKGGKLRDIQVKAVLDDATSGGLEAVPIVFDSLAVLTPLLVNELLPLVDQRVTTRRRVEGFKVANPEMYWTAEGTTPTTFSTNGFISEFNTNIHPCVGWMEMGLDFVADSPVQIANQIVSNYAQVAAQKLENAIATGSGTGQPLGLTNTPSITSVPSANDTAGPLTVGDYEQLLFAIPKAFRQEAGQRLVFISNDVTYRRSRSIQVGTSDQRRVFGMDHESYRLMDRSYRVNAGIGNSTILAACMNRYVLYRRAGFEVRRVTEDADLAKKNLEMLVVRMRYGGQLNHASACAAITDAQS